MLFAVWILGILTLFFLEVRFLFRLHALTSSALPLQSHRVRRLYENCLKELKISNAPLIYSTAFLKSPVLVGLFRPRIYLPIHLISDYSESEMRYMLLHELSHCRHRDALTGCLSDLAVLLYWFNPIVWYARREMGNDREIACDASVLELLDADAYPEYGNTLIHLAEKLSRAPFPFSSGFCGFSGQLGRRILSIASYEKPTLGKRIRSRAAFLLTSFCLLSLAPVLSAHAKDDSRYCWDPAPETIYFLDASEYFEDYQGSFVLYDLESDTWHIYHLEEAAVRTAPDSTYKIYDALFGLEEGVITPKRTLIPWDGTRQPFDAWNGDQTLASAMDASVNWYFQTLDQKLGKAALSRYLGRIGYGNQSLVAPLTSYWLESSLKISPIEQVELLTGLYCNDLGFAPENMQAVKDALLLSSSKTGALYGKTGTGRVEGRDVNGWFVGFVDGKGHTFVFAANIKGDAHASGSRAAEITMSLLSELGVWQTDL